MRRWRTCILRWGPFGVVRPTDAFAQAEASARRALELDANLGDAHRTLALVRMYHWDWPGADAAFGCTMATAPGSAETHCHYALYLVARGRCAEAVTVVEHARRLDPLSPMISNDRAFALWTARRYADAIDGHRQTLELDPHLAEARREPGLLHACLGDVDAALPELERAVTLTRDAETLACFGYGLAKAGRDQQARAILAELDALGTVATWSPPPTASSTSASAIALPRVDGTPWRGERPVEACTA